MDELITIDKTYLMRQIDQELRKDIFEIGIAGDLDEIEQIYQHISGMLDALNLVSLAVEGDTSDQEFQSMQQYIGDMHLKIMHEDSEAKRKLKGWK